MRPSLLWILCFEIVAGNVISDCTRNDDDVERSDRFCAAACTRQQKCRSQDRTCVCDGHCGYVCISPDVTCPILDSPDNGNVNVLDLRFGSVATYSCYDTFQIGGEAERRCQGDGSWSGIPATCRSEPRCLLSYLLRPEGVLLQRGPQEQYNTDERIRYICSRNYILSPSAHYGEIVCIDGEWHHDNHTCLPKGCRQPDVPDNGQAVASMKNVKHGSHAKYFCHDGYKLVGSVKASCSLGQWIYPEGQPFCQNVEYESDEPPIIIQLHEHPTCDNADRREDDNFQDNGSDSENAPILPTVSEVQLNSDPWWENEEIDNGEEEGPDGMCAIPHRPNVMVFVGNQQLPISVSWQPVGSELLFRCNDISRFLFSGSSRRVCLDGHWTGIPGRCTELMPGNRNSPPVINWRIGDGAAVVKPDGTLMVARGSNIHLGCLWPAAIGQPSWTYPRTREDDNYLEVWNAHQDVFTLTVWDAQEEDSGLYDCKSSRGRSHVLNIQITSHHPGSTFEDPVDIPMEIEPGLNHAPCELFRSPNIIIWYKGQELLSSAMLLPHAANVTLHCRDPGIYQFGGHARITCNDGHWNPENNAQCQRLLRNSEYYPPPIVMTTSITRAVLEDGTIVVPPGAHIMLDCLWVLPEPGDGWYHPTWFRNSAKGGDLELPAEIIRHSLPNGRGAYYSYRVGFHGTRTTAPTTYTCLTPHDLRHSVTIRITAYCFLESLNIPPDLIVDATTVRSIYAEGEQVRFVGCRSQRHLVGINTVTCLQNGGWSKPLLHCRSP